MDTGSCAVTGRGGDTSHTNSQVIVAGHLIVEADARNEDLRSCEAAVVAARINIYEPWSNASALAAFRGQGPDERQMTTLTNIDIDEYEIRR